MLLLSTRLCPRILLVSAASVMFTPDYSLPSFVPEDLTGTIVAEKQYFAALAAADSSTFQREFENPFVLLLDPGESKRYFQWRTLEARKAFLRAYWKAHNPNPLLPENDWLLDFIRRCAYVKQNFSSPQPPYFDDRGKYYLRYGKPWYRYERHYQYNLLPNESWSYRKVAADFLVHFVGRADGTFEEVPSLMSAIIGASSSDKAAIWAKLVHERAAVSPALAQASTKVNDLELPQLARASAGNLTPRILRIVQDHEYEVHEAIAQAPVAIYNPVKADNRLTFFHSIAQFRAPNGLTRLEVDFLSPLKKNLLGNLDSLSEVTLALEFSGMLRDQKFDSLAAARQSRAIPVGLAVREGLSYAAGNLSLISPPLTGELTLQVQDQLTEKIGYEQKSFVIRDFSGNNLLISDMQFYTEPANANQRQLLPAVKKQNFALAPYPYREVRKATPLFCYFEIYNLRAAGVADEYEIVYRVVTAKSRKGPIKKFSQWLSGAKDAAVSIALTRPVTDDTAPELIAIDLKSVPNGSYLLEIAVTAITDRTLAASAQKEITIVE